MKKNYMKPALTVQLVELQQMIAESLDVYGDTITNGSDILSRHRNKLWDDDEDDDWNL